MLLEGNDYHQFLLATQAKDSCPFNIVLEDGVSLRETKTWLVSVSNTDIPKKATSSKVRAKYEESKRSSLTKLVALVAETGCAFLSIVSKINVSELPSFGVLAEKKKQAGKNMNTKARNLVKRNFLD